MSSAGADGLLALPPPTLLSLLTLLHDATMRALRASLAAAADDGEADEHNEAAEACALLMEAFVSLLSHTSAHGARRRPPEVEEAAWRCYAASVEARLAAARAAASAQEDAELGVHEGEAAEVERSVSPRWRRSAARARATRSLSCGRRLTGGRRGSAAASRRRLPRATSPMTRNRCSRSSSCSWMRGAPARRRCRQLGCRRGARRGGGGGGRRRRRRRGGRAPGCLARRERRWRAASAAIGRRNAERRPSRRSPGADPLATPRGGPALVPAKSGGELSHAGRGVDLGALPAAPRRVGPRHRRRRRAAHRVRRGSGGVPPPLAWRARTRARRMLAPRLARSSLRRRAADALAPRHPPPRRAPRIDAARPRQRLLYEALCRAALAAADDARAAAVGELCATLRPGWWRRPTAARARTRSSCARSRA